MKNVSVLLFPFVASIHFVLQMMAWSFAPGNTAVNLSHIFLSRLWPVLSFPLFWVLPKDFDFPVFWVPFLINSVVWGLMVSGVLFFLRKSH